MPLIVNLKNRGKLLFRLLERQTHSSKWMAAILITGYGVLKKFMNAYVFSSGMESQQVAKQYKVVTSCINVRNGKK
jgi:hypothetical protein